MSKHPTSELSPRDIAAMDYGCYHFDVLDSFKRRRTWGNSYLRAKIKDAREARARIFRSCGNCTQMLSFVGIWNGEERYNCRCCGWVPESTGITCPHYKERREP